MSRRRTDSLESLSRRVFVHRLSFFGGGVVLLGSACDDKPKPPSADTKAHPTQQPSAGLSTSHKTFTNDEYAIVTALVGRIIPKDNDPGAIEADVPAYIDAILQTQQLQKMKEDFVGGVAAIDRRSSSLHNIGFASATPEQQDDVITVFKNSPDQSGEFKWYEILIALTMEGFLGDPSYGGNKAQVGWSLMGFDLVGHEAPEVEPDYKGGAYLDKLRCGTKKGC